MKRFFIVLLVTLVTLHQGARAQLVFSDSDLGLSLTVPSGFSAYEAGKANSARAIACYKRTNAAGKIEAILIEKLGGRLPQNRPLKASDVPTAAMFTSITIAQLPWNGFEIDCIQTFAKAGNTALYTASAQVPVRKEAVQISIAGPVEMRSELDQLMTELLSGLSAPTNWKPKAAAASEFAAPASASPSQRVDEPVRTERENAAATARLMVRLVFLGLAVLFVVWVIRRVLNRRAENRIQAESAAARARRGRPGAYPRR
jgi:hypothetical protein